MIKTSPAARGRLFRGTVLTGGAGATIGVAPNDIISIVFWTILFYVQTFIDKWLDMVCACTVLCGRREMFVKSSN